MPSKRLSMTPAQAESALESLRAGIPPRGMLTDFTAYPQTKVAALRSAIRGEGPVNGYLVSGAYGAGKSHLLALIRELALADGYAVSSITLDAAKGIRFNRMDQIIGSIMAGLELPGTERRGFIALLEATGENLAGTRLLCHPLDVVADAWRIWDQDILAPKIEEWLYSPQNFRTKNSLPLPFQLGVETHRQRYTAWRLPFSEYRFDTNDYAKSWLALKDLDTLAKRAGLKGLVILVDEFEDVVQNLNHWGWEMSALANLERMLSGKSFPGRCFFAVTPEFGRKVEHRIGWDAPSLLEMVQDPRRRFDVTRPTPASFMPLARRIRATHGIAYGWNAAAAVPDTDLKVVLADAFKRDGLDRTRQAVKALVEALDESMESVGSPLDDVA